MTSDCTVLPYAASYFGVTVKPSTHIDDHARQTQNCSASGCHSSFTELHWRHLLPYRARVWPMLHLPWHRLGRRDEASRQSRADRLDVLRHLPHEHSTGGFATFTMGSTGHSTLGVTITSNCTSCHTGSYYGVMVKPTTHVATTPANQNCSASGCHSSFTSFSGTTYTHSGVPVRDRATPATALARTAR